MKPYFGTLTVPDSRMKFKLSSFMTPTIRMNFPSDKKFAAELWSCPACRDDPQDLIGPLDRRDTQQHVMACEAYADLRLGKDLDTDQGLVDYFRQVIARRSGAENNDI